MGVFIKELTYQQLQPMLREDAVVVLPIGGGSKEHGGHLPMGTDYYVTDYVAQQVTQRADVLTLPTLPYAYFPAFVDWGGSVSIEHAHFIAFVRDIILSYARSGIKKFLIIDGGVSTHPPLCMLSRDLENEFGIRLAVSDITTIAAETEKALCTQKKGGHGDESETSTMLYINEALVHMEKTTEEYCEPIPGTVKDGRLVVYLAKKMSTPNGTNGNSTLATREKGEKILNAMVDTICEFLDEFTKAKAEEL